MAEKQGFFARIRGNAEWEAVRLIGGSGMLTSVWQIVKAAIHRDPRDWWLWGSVFGVGFLLAALGYWREYKSSFRKVNEATVVGAPSDLDEAEMLAWSNRYNTNRLLKIGNQADTLFTETQLEAFQVTKLIGDLLKDLPEVPEINREDFPADNTSHMKFIVARVASREPRVAAFTKLQARYTRTLAGRFKNVVLQLREHGADRNPWIDNYFDSLPDESYIKPVQETLISMAHSLNGVRLGVTLPKRGTR